jgi:hypothetical protein
MLDRMIKGAFDQMAGTEQPPARVSVTQAMQQGRARRRRQRLTAAGAPVLAAVAALAIGLTGVIGSGQAGRSQLPTSGATARTPAAPKYFNPLRPYAAFGWLPHGASGGKATGTFGQDEILMYAPMAALTSLVLHAAGRCRVSGHALRCNVAGQGSPDQVLGHLIGDVDGHPAYWASHDPGALPVLGNFKQTSTLAWQYARGGWAILGSPTLGDALRTADSMRFGPDVSPLVRFAFQLTGVPANWQVNAVITGWRDGVMYATSYQITAGHVDAVPEGNPMEATPLIETGPGGKDACAGLIYYGARPAVIDGYRVTLGSDRMVPLQLCAADAEGMFVWINFGIRPTLSPADLFGHHLRLLGSDPARWTTQPVG